MESKYKHLYNQLQDQIEKREYKAGDKLPAGFPFAFLINPSCTSKSSAFLTVSRDAPYNSIKSPSEIGQEPYDTSRSV